MDDTYLVMDIETVPDLTVWEPASAKKEIEKIEMDSKPSKPSLEFMAAVVERLRERILVHPDDIEKARDIARRAKLDEEFNFLSPLIAAKPPTPPEFAPLHAQTPVAIGCVWLGSDMMVRKIGCLRVPLNAPLLEAEGDMLREWNAFMAKERPTIVTWNGRSFDMPVLSLRSFRHGINLAWYYGNKDYRYRYSEDKHADLMDAMADYGAARFLKLDAIAQLAGLPGKHGDMDGSKVAGMYAEGKIEQIANYCTSDTLQTAFVFLRWRLTKGRIDLPKYQEAVQALLTAMTLKPELKELYDLINQDQLMLKTVSSPT